MLRQSPKEDKAMFKTFLVCMFFTIAAHSQVVVGDTTSEIREVILANLDYMNENSSQDPNRISSKGTSEFWSSGGLLNQIAQGSSEMRFEYFKGVVKHISVIPLVKDKAAVAHYYQEAVMQPEGLPKVPNYRTRVTQVFIKEDDQWKVRASHFSPLEGGAGTSHSVIN